MNKEKLDAIFLDLSKAFDTVPHVPAPARAATVCPYTRNGVLLVCGRDRTEARAGRERQ